MGSHSQGDLWLQTQPVRGDLDSQDLGTLHKPGPDPLTGAQRVYTWTLASSQDITIPSTMETNERYLVLS